MLKELRDSHGLVLVIGGLLALVFAVAASIDAWARCVVWAVAPVLALAWFVGILWTIVPIVVCYRWSRRGYWS